MHPLRSLILAAAESDTIHRIVATAPGTRAVVDRFVAGETCADAVAAVAALTAQGAHTTLDYLGEDTTNAQQAERTVQAYLTLLDRLHAEDLSATSEVSLKLTAIGLQLDPRLAGNNAFRICAAAAQCQTTVTVDMEDHTTTDDTLRIVSELRQTWPSVGAVVQCYLYRTEKDLAELTAPGSRVRLVKGAYAEPAEVAYEHPHDVDLSFVRCTNALLAGDGFPMFGTHDPRLIAIAQERAAHYGRAPGEYEFQMLYGVRPDEQRRLADIGETVRVYIPYGEQWYGYLMRRLAERPANTTFFLRAVAGRS